MRHPGGCIGGKTNSCRPCMNKAPVDVVKTGGSGVLRVAEQMRMRSTPNCTNRVEPDGRTLISIPVSSLVRVRVHGASRPVAPWGTGRPSRPDSGGTGPVTSRIMSVDLESNVLSAVSGRTMRRDGFTSRRFLRTFSAARHRGTRFVIRVLLREVIIIDDNDKYKHACPYCCEAGVLGHQRHPKQRSL